MLKDLPYIFDLLWDIKEKWILEKSIISNIEDVASKLESMEDTGIQLSSETRIAVLIAIDQIKTYIK